MTNKSFRIVNMENEHATVWPIGMGDYYTVHFEEADENWTYSKEQVESALEKGSWIAAGGHEVPFDTYTAKLHDNEEVAQPYLNKLIKDLSQYQHCMSYNDSYFGEPEGFLKRAVRQMAKEIDKQGDKVDISNLKIEIDTSEIRKEFDEIIDGAILAKIKAFTTDSGHSVFVHDGIYKVYRAEEDCSYIARDEETLIEVMEAITTLDSVETE